MNVQIDQAPASAALAPEAEGALRESIRDAAMNHVSLPIGPAAKEVFAALEAAGTTPPGVTREAIEAALLGASDTFEAAEQYADAVADIAVADLLEND